MCVVYSSKEWEIIPAVNNDFTQIWRLGLICQLPSLPLKERIQFLTYFDALKANAYN